MKKIMQSALISTLILLGFGVATFAQAERCPASGCTDTAPQDPPPSDEE